MLPASARPGSADRYQRQLLQPSGKPLSLRGDLEQMRQLGGVVLLLVLQVDGAGDCQPIRRAPPAIQRRISTGLKYPDEAAKSLQLAEELGRALERHRAGIELFDWSPWLAIGRQAKALSNSEQATIVSGLQAIRMTREWWGRQRLRGPSAEDSWKIDHQAPLTPLQEINPLKPEHLIALVQTTQVGSRSRRRAS